MSCTSRSIPAAARFTAGDRRPALAAILLIVLLAPTLESAPALGEPGFAVAPSFGVFDAPKNEATIEAGLELRFSPFYKSLLPAVGVMITGDHGYFAYGGLRYDVPVGERWWITPSFGIGSYKDGKGKNLGQSLQFRSGLEVALEVSHRSRLGLTVYHLSNASLAHKNPGEESLILTWSLLWP